MARDLFDNLAAELVGGAQEEFVADLTLRLARMLRRGVENPDLLGQLGRLSREKALAVWAEWEGRVTGGCRAAFEEAMAEEDERIVGALRALSPSVAYDTAYGSMVAAEAARGVGEILRRQNVALCDAMADSWYRITADAVTRVESGEGLRAAMERACAALADAGLETVDYRSGVRTSADAAMRRHLVTQWNQARADLLWHRMDEWECDLVFTSAHYGARPTHAVWQGKVFSRSGSSPDYPDLVQATGYGTVTGLCGANCRHEMTPYVEGYSQLPDTDFSEQERITGMTSEEYYEATQRQRRYEAAIRKTKREIAVGREAGLDMVDKRVLLGRQQARVRQWCRDKGLPRDYERERAYGVGTQPRALGRTPALSSSARRAETAPKKAAARAGELSSDEAKAIAKNDMLVKQLGSKAAGDFAAAIDDAIAAGGPRKRAAQAIAQGIQGGTIKIETKKHISRNQFDANRGKVFLRPEYVSPRMVAHECAHALDFLTEVTYGPHDFVSHRKRWTSREYTDGSGYIAILMKDDWANLVAKHDDPIQFVKGRASALGLGKSYSDAGFLDDMLEAASGTQMPLGIGSHMIQNPQYWSQLRGQMPSIEALADYAGSAIGNEIEWDLMRELFPQATHAMDALLEAILNATS